MNSCDVVIFSALFLFPTLISPTFLSVFRTIAAYWAQWLQNHRIREWFGLEATFKNLLVHPHCHGQGHLSLDQVAQSPVQPDLEHFQWRGTHNFSGQAVPTTRIIKKFVPYVQPKSNLFQFKIFAPCPVTIGLDILSSLSSSFLQAPFVHWKAAVRSPQSLLFSRLNSPKSQPFFIGEVFQSLSSWKAARQKRTLGCWLTAGWTWASSVLRWPRRPTAS